MTAIKVSCSHQTSYLPMEGPISVEYVKPLVCEDASLTEVDYTAVRRAEFMDNDGPTLFHLFVTEANGRGDTTYLLTRDGLVIDKKVAPLSALDDFWGGVELQLEEVKMERSFLEVLDHALRMSEEDEDF